MIPDEALSKVTSILKAANFSPCSKGQQCVHAHDTVQYRSSPAPSEHFHMLDPNVIMLFRKSEMLWKVDNFQTSSKIILASNRSYLPGNDPGLGEGAFPQPVRTVRVHQRTASLRHTAHCSYGNGALNAALSGWQCYATSCSTWMEKGDLTSTRSSIPDTGGSILISGKAISKRQWRVEAMRLLFFWTTNRNLALTITTA